MIERQCSSHLLPQGGKKELKNSVPLVKGLVNIASLVINGLVVMTMMVDFIVLKMYTYSIHYSEVG